MPFKSINNFPTSRNGLLGSFINGKGEGFSALKSGSSTIYDTGTISATGGSKFTSGGKTVHVFTSPGTFTVSAMQSGVSVAGIEFYIISGGGGGGRYGGGGGAGGALRGTHYFPESDVGVSNSVIIGPAGSGGTSGNPGGNGGPSSIFGLSSLGGGGGGSQSGAATPGGSGGGGSWATSIGGSGVSGQGFDGGDTRPGTGTYRTSGGGGAAEVGTDAATPSSGPGGDGIGISWTQLPSSYGETNPTSPGRWFAGGGGGGGSPQYGHTAGNGGMGGGANGSTTTGNNATVNTGGGGGGGGNTPGVSYDGGTGGTGIVLIRYSPL